MASSAAAQVASVLPGPPRYRLCESRRRAHGPEELGQRTLDARRRTGTSAGCEPMPQRWWRREARVNDGGIPVKRRQRGAHQVSSPRSPSVPSFMHMRRALSAASETVMAGSRRCRDDATPEPRPQLLQFDEVIGARS
jgi:hypothetical protein